MMARRALAQCIVTSFLHGSVRQNICCLLGHSPLLKILLYEIVVDVNKERLGPLLWTLCLPE